MIPKKLVLLYVHNNIRENNMSPAHIIFKTLTSVKSVKSY